MFEKMPERVGDLPNPLSLLRTASDRYTGHAAGLSGGWEDFASRLPNRKRWRTRRFRELGERSLTLAKTPEQYDVFIEALVRQTRDRYPRALGLPDEVAYLEMARRLVYPAGPVCLFALKINDTIIATEFCLLREQWMIGQIISHEGGSWLTYAPGHLLNTMVCEWCFANGIQVLDFGIGDYPYKNDYCDVVIKLWQAELPANMRGRLASHWRAAGDWKRERRRRFALGSRPSVARPGIKRRHHLFCELVPLNQQVRRKLASISALRSAWHLARALRNELRWRPVSQSKYAKCFTVRTDPFGYEVAPFALEKFQATIELLDGVRGDACFERAWEIGCAEGAMTARFAKICEGLSAVDYVPLALERARVRCQEFSNVSFSEWDLKSDPVPGTFDLIVITDVLGSLGGRRDIRRARDKVVSALAPGGYLLYGDFLGGLHSRRIHDSWWGRLLLLRPLKILRLVAAHPALVEVARRETTMHLLVLFRNRR